MIFAERGALYCGTFENGHFKDFLVFIADSVTSLLFSAFSPVTARTGTGAFALMRGLFPAVKRGRSGKTVRRGILAAAVLGVAVVSGACAPLQVPLEPKVGKLELGAPQRADAVLFLSDDARNYVYLGKPDGDVNGDRMHEFPLREALEMASLETFPQVFQSTFLVYTSADAEKHAITIEPRIEEFHFRYDMLSYAGFAMAVYSRIKVHVTVLGAGRRIIWEKSVQSPEEKEGPWVLNLSYEKDAGESASDALVFSIKEIAAAMYKDAETIKSLAESPQ